jgi:hypothetical protein
MANTTLQTSVIAKEAITILDNELGMGNKVFRGYEEDIKKEVNGYKQGGTLTVRRPADFTVRDGATASAQDVVEGSTTITVDKQKGVDFEFSSSDLTLDIGSLSERVIKPAMVQLANQIDSDLHALYTNVPNWVGTPGQTVDAFADFYKAPERLNEFGVPMDGRCGVLSPADDAALAGAASSLYMQDVARSAYRKGMTGNLGGVDNFMSQNVKTHTVGVNTGTPKIIGGSQNVTYDSVKTTYQQTLLTDGWTNSTTGILKAGDVFTIDDVYAVNPVTKATLPFLRQFTVLADADSGASTGPATLTITPPIITSGAQQTCSAVPANDADINVLGTGATGYRQNMVFHKNAFALVSVPLISPPGAVDVARETYKGTSVRVIPVYDGTNDTSMYRLDVLYGVKCIDNRLATRLSGTSS